MQTLTTKMGLILALGLTMLASCGSGSGDSSSDSSVTYSGSVTASSVDGATVELLKESDSSVVGTTTTDADGKFSFTFASALTHKVRIKATGGTYTDEATGTAGTALDAVDGLQLVLDPEDLTSSTNVAVTPMAHMISHMHASGATLAQSRTALNDFIQSIFGFTLSHATLPVDANATPGSVTMAQKRAGFVAAVFSQMANDLGCTHTELMATFGTDLADGTLGGATNGGCTIPADVTTQVRSSALAFLVSGNNKVGVPLGTPTFITSVTTAGGTTFAYSAMMNAMQGIHKFKVAISDAGGVVTGLGTVNFAPMMYMAGKKHAAPKDGCIETATLGTYECTVYYLMPTAMAGMTMGVWELAVTDGANTAKFYPPVMMGMGDTTKVELKGIATNGGACDMARPDDCITMMGMNSQKKYQIFPEVKSGGTVGIFLSQMMMMTNFPAVAGAVVELSFDSGTTWSAMTDATGGHYTFATGLTGTQTILVRITVGGEMKTQDGLPTLGTGTAGDPYTQGIPYQTLTVTIQ